MNKFELGKSTTNPVKLVEYHKLVETPLPKEYKDAYCEVYENGDVKVVATKDNKVYSCIQEFKNTKVNEEFFAMTGFEDDVFDEFGDDEEFMDDLELTNDMLDDEIELADDIDMSNMSLDDEEEDLEGLDDEEFIDDFDEDIMFFEGVQPQEYIENHIQAMKKAKISEELINIFKNSLEEVNASSSAERAKKRMYYKQNKRKIAMARKMRKNKPKDMKRSMAMKKAHKKYSFNEMLKALPNGLLKELQEKSFYRTFKKLNENKVDFTNVDETTVLKAINSFGTHLIIEAEIKLENREVCMDIYKSLVESLQGYYDGEVELKNIYEQLDMTLFKVVQE